MVMVVLLTIEEYDFLINNLLKEYRGKIGCIIFFINFGGIIKILLYKI